MSERKTRPRIGTVLTTAGGAVGMLAAIAMAIGLKMTITPEMQQVLMYKGMFAASIGLIVAGAVYGRHEQRATETKPGMSELPGPPPPEEFPAGGTRETIHQENKKGPL